MPKEDSKNKGMVKKISSFFSSVSLNNNVKKSIKEENRTASKNNPELINILDSKDVRKKEDPEWLLKIIADAIASPILEEEAKKNGVDKELTEKIGAFIEDGERNLKIIEEKNIQQSRSEIMDGLRKNNKMDGYKIFSGEEDYDKEKYVGKFTKNLEQQKKDKSNEI